MKTSKTNGCNANPDKGVMTFEAIINQPKSLVQISSSN